MPPSGGSSHRLCERLFQHAGQAEEESVAHLSRTGGQCPAWPNHATAELSILYDDSAHPSAELGRA
eukprot:393369-Heterocapsa_arctica.AAC.1